MEAIDGMETIITPTLAALVTPGLFLGGLGAAAAPVLIHLLARRRFKRIRWAAMDFLLHAERKNKRRLRMEEWLLLALRCLAMIMIGMTLARPFLSPASLSGVFRGSNRTERIIILDDSLSMTYRTSDGAVFERAKQAIERLIDTFRAEAPDDTVTLFRTSELDAPVESGTYLDDSQTEAMRARLEALSPSQGTLDPTQVIETVAAMLRDSPGVISAAVYVISDFQESTWTQREADVEGGEGEDRLFSPLAEWAQEDRGLFVTFVNVGERSARNTAITSFEMNAGPLVAGTPSTAIVKIGNFGDRPLESLPVRVFVSDIAQESKHIDGIPSSGEVSTEVDVEFLRCGYEWARAEIPEDSLPGDNVRYLAADVAESIRVLLVNGEPSPVRYDDEVTYLTTALRPEGIVASGNDPVVMDESEWEDANLENFHLVILANVYRVSEPMVDSLERFVRSGGGLLVFAGDQTDADSYNTSLYRGGEGLLPAVLRDVQRPADAVHLQVTDRLHPALRGISGDGDPLGIGTIRFHTFWRMETDRDSETIDDAGAGNDADDISPVAPVRVLARFDDLRRSPAIVERRFGAGRVMLVATSADKEWSNWADHPTYLPVVLELAHHLARRTGASADYHVGDAIKVALDPALYLPDIGVRTPAYPDEREVGLTAFPIEERGGLMARWDRATDAGLYRFVLQRRDGGETIRVVAVNVDPRESDLTMADEDELRRLVGDTPFRYVEGLAALATDAEGERRTEFWRAFLIAAIVLLFSEQTLAWLWGRRR